MLDWCADAGAAAIPFGGGTSVVRRGGAARCGELRRRGHARPAGARPRARGRRGLARRPDPGRRHRARARGAAARARADAAPLPAVVRVLDARRLDRHARGRPLRHAARRTSTTSWSRCARSRRAGEWESRRLPGSGAGPSPDRMLIGSEGILGVITEAWVRVQAAAALQGVGRRAVRRLRGRARARCARWPSRGSSPSNCRLLDPGEAALTGAAPDGQGAAGARLRVGRPPARRLAGARRSSCARDHGGRRRRAARAGERERVRPRARGATPSCRRPTCATRWWPRASWPRRSRRRSPGTASTRSWPRSRERGARAALRRRAA